MYLEKTHADTGRAGKLNTESMFHCDESVNHLLSILSKKHYTFHVRLKKKQLVILVLYTKKQENI